MAIHDVDKNSTDRGQPLPNSHDAHPLDLRNAHGTNSVNYISDATPDAFKLDNTNGMLRLVQKGTVHVDQPGAGTAGFTTVTHNLGYIPIVMAFIGTSTTIYNPLPQILSSSVATNVTIEEYITVANITSTDFQIEYYQGSSAASAPDGYNITYYIFHETAN